ncbi:MAG TPA: 2-phosphosulfolactate phosphatase [Chitinophagaceae bacterium]|nr:2-phosphosulfolactate phosphatase [Chitinophagaceae bacterium]
MKKEKNNFPALYTCLSPSLLHLYNVSDSIVVIIDILRATSTIATALHNGAKNIIPVDSVAECIKLGKQMDAITAGERDGKIAEGLKYGNTPLQYTQDFIEGKILILTTTNGTRLLHMALSNGALEIMTGAFSNLSAVCEHLLAQNKNVILACAAWKDRINIEDTLFAGAVISRIKERFRMNCDSSRIAESLYDLAQDDLFAFMKEKNASHYQRLMGYGLEQDIRYCLTIDKANALVLYKEGRLVKV